MNNYLELPAVKVVQPLGIFYSVMLPADKLEKIVYVARAKYKSTGIFDKIFSPIEGTQRPTDLKRERDIANYINTSESALPNAIILGANINKNGNLVRQEKRWYIKEVADGFYKLIIPTEEELASVIDGQHRLYGCLASERRGFELVCSVYLDIPAPYHAFIFATINANQKKVDRSLAYDLYGFGLDSEKQDTWSPEKLAVYIVRKLAAKSTMKGKIILGAQSEEDESGVVSLAAMVGGILKLFSANPKRDRDEVLYHKNSSGRETLIAKTNSPPLRQKYIDGQDEYIERMVFDFVRDVTEIVMSSQDKNSFIIKTVGYQALFSYLKSELMRSKGVYNADKIQKDLEVISKVDFTLPFYNASGMGESRIRNSILLVLGMKKVDSLAKSRDFEHYEKFIDDNRSLILE